MPEFKVTIHESRHRYRIYAARDAADAEDIACSSDWSTWEIDSKRFPDDFSEIVYVEEVKPKRIK